MQTEVKSQWHYNERVKEKLWDRQVVSFRCCQEEEVEEKDEEEEEEEEEDARHESGKPFKLA